MVTSGGAVVPAEAVVQQMSGITVLIPTLNRPSLNEAKRTLDTQTLKPDKIVYMDGPGDPLTKFRNGLEKVDTEFVALGDDDISYPDHWLESMMDVMKTDPSIGFVGGTMLPMSMIQPATETEKTIAFILGSFFGTTNMSQRVKIKEKIEERDETNMVGAGLVRTKVAKEALSDKNIVPSFHDTWMIHRIKMLGFKTMYSPKSFFYHKTRTNVFSFAAQMIRCGSGRTGYFKAYPAEAIRKFYILFPMFFFMYLIAFFGFAFLNFPIIPGWPLVAYVAINLFISLLIQKGKWTLPLYYAVMHISYGFGETIGLFRSFKKWT